MSKYRKSLLQRIGEKLRRNRNDTPSILEQEIREFYSKELLESVAACLGRSCRDCEYGVRGPDKTLELGGEKTEFETYVCEKKIGGCYCKKRSDADETIRAEGLEM